ncbi:MAG TPA: S8 family peptidase [Balneolaceae bacterium]|nr:S8 family peptidase [Balneolaceae bacterium]
MKLRILLASLLIIFFTSCSTSHEIVKPQPKQAPDSVNFSALKNPPKDWDQLDQSFTRFPGISSKLAYKYILNKRKPKKKVVVAVVDGGVDIHQKDLKGHIWTNKDEIPGNGKDDDHNGYVDDVHGWNFIGGPNGNVNNDTYEVTRIYARLYPKFHNADTTKFTPQQEKQYKRYKKVRKDYKYQINKTLQRFKNIQSLQESMHQADSILTRHFNGSFTYKQVRQIKPQNQQIAFAKNVMSYVMKNNIDSTVIAKQKKHIYDDARYGYNPNFDPRHIVGDNYQDKTQHDYGNNQVGAAGPMHGTHVSGIIAAIRNNGIGMNGIAGKDVRIMPVRVVPDGDERDKDVANGIRYAVNNGADIINMSFGKRYSPYKKVVDQAVKYADKHGVLMVHAAGNSSQNTDKKPTYPTDRYGRNLKGGTAKLWISVGASSWKPGKNFVASFSNYGKHTVDLFAPGVDVYSSVLHNKFKRESGTSMAAPVVSGVAAVIMEYYPKLSAAQVKKIILDSTKKFPNKKVIYPHKPGKKGKVGLFSNLSVTGGEVNLFNALQMAQKMSK